MATKITSEAVIKAKIRVGNIFKFKKLPICPPIKTAKKKYQQFATSNNTVFFVSCPIIPETELIKINKEAAVTICLDLPAFSKNNIGLKKIPPPIPTTPEINPSAMPIGNENSFGILL